MAWSAPLYVMIGSLTCPPRYQHVMVRSIACHDRFLTMPSSVPSCHDRFLSISSSLPSCHGLFLSGGSCASGDVSVADVHWSDEGDVVLPVNLGVLQVWNVALVAASCVANHKVHVSHVTNILAMCCDPGSARDVDDRRSDESGLCASGPGGEGDRAGGGVG